MASRPRLTTTIMRYDRIAVCFVVVVSAGGYTLWHFLDQLTSSLTISAPAGFPVPPDETVPSVPVSFGHSLALESAPLNISQLQEEASAFEGDVDANLSAFGQQCPYNAAILYLVKGSETSNFLLSISLVLRNIPLQCFYPILLFHEGDFRDPSAQKILRDKLFRLLLGRMDVDGPAFVARALEAINGVEFLEIEFRLPEGISSNITEVDPVFPEVWPGYHSMCNFFFADLTEHPRIQDLDYYLRLDTDSFILDRMSYDPIERVFLHGRTYGYLHLGKDVDWVTRGFFPTIKAYAETHLEVQERMDLNGWDYPDDNCPQSYFNNFEIMHVPSFRTPAVRDWVLNVTSEPLHIFKYRWGDAPLRRATVCMFLDLEHDVEQLCDVSYYHQGPISTCSSVEEDYDEGQEV